METNQDNVSHLVEGEAPNTDSFLYTTFSYIRCPNNNLHKWPEQEPLKAALDRLGAAFTGNDRSHPAFAYDCGHNTKFDGLPPLDWLATTQRTSFRSQCETLVSCDHPGCITPKIATIFKLVVEPRPTVDCQLLPFQSDHGLWRIRVVGFLISNEFVKATADDYFKLVLVGPNKM